QRLRHLVRRRVPARAGAPRSRRRGSGPAQALDRRGRAARRDRHRQPPAEAHAASVRVEGRGDSALRREGDRRAGRAVRAAIHRRRRARARARAHSAGARQGVPAARLGRRRQSLLEMQVDADDGSVWVMIHCGSRGYGWQTANHYFHAGAALRGLPKNRREESWLRADEPLGREYWAHHNSAANYAVANRHIIVRGVQQALERVFGVTGEVFYEISHNLVQEETLVLPDGTTQRGFVHRKGATRAFPAGHPDLAGTPWAETGHPCLVPGSMLDGAAILYPLDGAYRSGCSVNHGSGRVMARGRAKRELAKRHDAIDAEMRDIERVLGGVTIRGIVGNTKRTPLDECGHVYKDLGEVLRVLEAEGIARVAHRLYPVASIKGMD